MPTIDPTTGLLPKRRPQHNTLNRFASWMILRCAGWGAGRRSRFPVFAWRFIEAPAIPYPSCKCAPAEVHGATPQNNTMKRPSRVRLLRTKSASRPLLERQRAIVLRESPSEPQFARHIGFLEIERPVRLRPYALHVPWNGRTRALPNRSARPLNPATSHPCGDQTRTSAWIPATTARRVGGGVQLPVAPLRAFG